MINLIRSIVLLKDNIRYKTVWRTARIPEIISGKYGIYDTEPK